MSNLKTILNAAGLEVAPAVIAADASETAEKAEPNQDETTSLEFETDGVATETVSSLSKNSCGC